MATMLVLPDYVIRAQVCATCCQYRSIGPVGITPKNKDICGRCSSGMNNITPSLYNVVAKYCVFKCDHHYQGCSKRLYFNEISCHKNICQYKNRSTVCVMCSTKLTNFSHLVNHYLSTHSQYITINSDDYTTIDFSKCKGLHLYIKNNDIVRLDWAVNATKLVLQIRGEPKDSISIGTIHFQITVFKDTCPQIQFSSAIASSTDEVVISLNLLKIILGCEKTLTCKISFFVQVNGQYLPLMKYSPMDGLRDKRMSITANKIHAVSKFKIFFSCLNCTAILDEDSYSCSNGHIFCSTCSETNCSKCSLLLTTWIDGGTLSLKAFDSCDEGLSILKCMDQILLKCPWEGCPLYLLPQDIILHQLNCKFRSFYCPSSSCKESMSLNVLRQHWHLSNPLDNFNKTLDIIVRDGLSIYWMPDNFKNIFKVAVNYLVKYEEAIIDILYIDVILTNKYDFMLKYKGKIYQPVKTGGKCRVFTMKDCIKENDLLELHVNIK